MTRFLHITDLHVKARGGRSEEALDRLHKVVPQLAPDFVIASGDLTDHGDSRSYARLAARMAALQVPVVYALGNHDKRAAFRTAFPGHPGAPDDPLDHVREIAGLQIVVLDSSVPGQTSGALDAAQFEALDAALDVPTALRRILVIHHPPFTGGGRSWAYLDPSDSARLARVLAGRGVEAIFCGHVHLNRLSLWQGLPVIAAVGLHSTVDPFHEVAREGGLHVTKGTAVGVCEVRDGGIDIALLPLLPGETVRAIPGSLLAGLR